MCTGGFAKCLGISLMPLAVVCVLCNILLFFPAGQTVDSEHITDEVWYFGGLLGSGVLVSSSTSMTDKLESLTQIVLYIVVKTAGHINYGT